VIKFIWCALVIKIRNERSKSALTTDIPDPSQIHIDTCAAISIVLQTGYHCSSVTNPKISGDYGLYIKSLLVNRRLNEVNEWLNDCGEHPFSQLRVETLAVILSALWSCHSCGSYGFCGACSVSWAPQCYRGSPKIPVRPQSPLIGQEWTGPCHRWLPTTLKEESLQW